MNESMEKIGKYRIQKFLGRGGFGAVYLCHDHDKERDVAIKVFRPRNENLVAFATSSSEDGLQVLQERFMREALILLQLHNPYIIDIYDYDCEETEEGSLYYVMPYVASHLGQFLGRDVFDRAALAELDQSDHPRALPLGQCLTLLHQILQGMKTAHEHGLVHRDIKPSNILLDAGEVRIADFGFAKHPKGPETSVALRSSGNYMAPEQQQSAKHVDKRADIYSIGVLAYRMLTGRLPTGRYEDPKKGVPQLGNALNLVILTAMSENKEKRFKDAGEMLAAYEEALQQRTQGDEAGSQTTADTVTTSDGPVSGLPEDFRPLYDIIKETLLEHGAITPRQRAIEAMAAVLKIDGKAMQLIVANVTATHKEIPALQKLLNLIEREIEKLPAQTAGKKAQTQKKRLINDLLHAAELAGKDKAWLKVRLQEALKAQNRSSPRASSHRTSKQVAGSSDARSGKRRVLLVVVAIVAVSVVGLWFWSGGLDDAGRSTPTRSVETATLPPPAVVSQSPSTGSGDRTNTVVSGRSSGRSEQTLPPGVTVLPAGTGQLIVLSEPAGAAVYIDGQNTGEVTPVTLNDVTAGTRDLSLRLAGYQTTVAQTVKVEEEQAAQVSEILRKTWRLTVNTTPGDAAIRLPDISPAYRPGMDLLPGEYRVEVSAPEHVSQTRTVSLVDSDQVIEFDLEPFLPVVIISNVTDARIILSGNGNDYIYQNDLQLPAGSYQVSAEAEGYIPLSETWDVSKNNGGLLYLKLESIETFRDSLADGGEGPLMAVLPAGSFRMGCLSNDSDCNDSEQPVHVVTLPNNFAMAVYEVSVAEYNRYAQATGATASRRSNNWPASNVDYGEARAYARWLSEQTGHSYRLPTEAEWEYAARARTTTKYSWGNEASHLQANYDGRSSRWRLLAPVGSFPANNFGLYDMHGNVWEWTQDCFHDSYNGAPTNGQAWDWEGVNGGDCDMRVVRGGSWDSNPRGLRAASRIFVALGVTRASFAYVNGLRLVRDLP